MSRARLADGGVRRLRPLVPVVVRGLAVSVGSTLAAVAVAAAMVRLWPVDASACDGDLACLPDVGLAIAALASIPVAIAVAGPLMARLLRLRYPALFVLPSLWAAGVVCVWLGPADAADRWPFNDVVSSALILWIPYVVLALAASWAATDDRRYLDASASAAATTSIPQATRSSRTDIAAIR
jgi:hypothetical protein